MTGIDRNKSKNHGGRFTTNKNDGMRKLNPPVEVLAPLTTLANSNLFFLERERLHRNRHRHHFSTVANEIKCREKVQNDPETGAFFSQPPLISFKRDKNVGNFLVKSTFKTIEKPGTFKCARSRCKTCPFVQNADKISGPKRSVKITDRFTCTSANVIYCITCTLCRKLYIGETGRRLGDRFREHLRDVEKNDKEASKPVARHFNLPNHFREHMSICGFSLHQGTTDSRKNLEQRFIFQIGTLNPHRINERFSFN